MITFPLKVANMVMSGKIPLEHKLDYAKVVSSCDGWVYFEHRNTPLVQKKFDRNDGTRSNRYKRKCNITVSIWASGSINIVGLRSVEEGEEIRDQVVKELEAGGIL